MKKTVLTFSVYTSILISFFGFLLFKTNPVESAIAMNLVISEIKVGATGDANDEFIEIYNPNGTPVNLAGWRVTRMTSTGTESNLIASMSGTIPAHGFFLLTNDESPASDSADLIYAASVAPNNTINLYSDAGNTLIDRVGMGIASVFESTPAAQPANNQSIERKANNSSTAESMASGDDVLEGNGWDTDDNGDDFVLRTSPNPQNSSSQIEPQPTASPSATPSATPTASPSASPSATPSATPTATPSPTPSSSPTASPTATPTPSASPSASPSPSATPAPNTGFPFGSPFYRLSCSVTPITIDRGFFKFTYPRISCNIVRI